MLESPSRASIGRSPQGSAANPADPILNSIQAAASRLGVCQNTVRNLVSDGSLVAVKLRARTLIPESNLRAYAERLAAENRASLVPTNRRRAA